MGSSAVRLRAPRLAGQGIDFTTGELAKLWRVSTRTVTKWCDTGALVSHRLPRAVPGVSGGTRVNGDRRIMKAHAVEFAKRHGLPVPEWEAVPVAVLLDRPVAGAESIDEFELGLRSGRSLLVAVVFGTTQGLAYAKALAERLGVERPTLPMGLVLGDDHDAASFTRPWGPFRLATHDAAEALAELTKPAARYHRP